MKNFGSILHVSIKFYVLIASNISNMHSVCMIDVSYVYTDINIPLV